MIPFSHTNNGKGEALYTENQFISYEHKWQYRWIVEGSYSLCPGKLTQVKPSHSNMQ